MKRIAAFFAKNRQLIPLMSTALLALTAYGIGAYFFVGMRNPQVFFNLFRNSAHLLISGVGMTFVILTGGIVLLRYRSCMPQASSICACLRVSRWKICRRQLDWG